jgi:hypothetical protein
MAKEMEVVEVEVFWSNNEVYIQELDQELFCFLAGCPFCGEFTYWVADIMSESPVIGCEHVSVPIDFWRRMDIPRPEFYNRLRPVIFTFKRPRPASRSTKAERFNSGGLGI